MKKVTANKKAKVQAPLCDQAVGVMFYQVVEFVISYFGNEIICEHDTRVMADGKQYVIGGDGFISDGFEVLA